MPSFQAIDDKGGFTAYSDNFHTLILHNLTSMSFSGEMKAENPASLYCNIQSNTERVKLHYDKNFGGREIEIFERLTFPHGECNVCGPGKCYLCHVAVHDNGKIASFVFL